MRRKGSTAKRRMRERFPPALLVAPGAKGPSSTPSRKRRKAGAAVARRSGAEDAFPGTRSLGEWALVYGKLAAARQGAADRIRREATIAYLMDPKLEAGTPPRVLGRLHDQTPRIPFITGWASSKEAVRFLEESLRIDPTNAITIVFLAEALVSNDRRQPRAIQLLRARSGRRPRLCLGTTAAHTTPRAAQDGARKRTITSTIIASPRGRTGVHRPFPCSTIGIASCSRSRLLTLPLRLSADKVKRHVEPAAPHFFLLPRCRKKCAASR